VNEILESDKTFYRITPRAWYNRLYILLRYVPNSTNMLHT